MKHHRRDGYPQGDGGLGFRPGRYRHPTQPYGQRTQYALAAASIPLRDEVLVYGPHRQILVETFGRAVVTWRTGQVGADAPTAPEPPACEVIVLMSLSQECR